MFVPFFECLAFVAERLKLFVRRSRGRNEFRDRMTASGLRDATGNPPGFRWLIIENRPGLPNIAPLHTSSGVSD